MRVLTLATITSVALLVSSAAAQTPPPQTPPAQTPPAQTPPPTAKPEPAKPEPAKPEPAKPEQAKPEQPKPAPQPPAPFPEGSRIAYIDVQRIAAESIDGKAASVKIKALQDQKQSELKKKNDALLALQNKASSGTTVLSESAMAQLQKDIDKAQREIQFFQQDAQSDVENLNRDLMSEFQTKLVPIINQVATERGLLMVFTAEQGVIAWALPGLDISPDIVKRMDSASKTAPKK